MFLKNLFKKEKEYKKMNNKSLYEEALEKCKNNEEMWIKIKGYDNYELSNLGNARKLNADGTYKEIGYYDKFENRMKIQLTGENAKMKSTTLASLMGETFEIPNPKNRKQIMPNDGNTMNCRLDNLRYRHNKDREEMSKLEYSDKDRIDNELINKQIKQQQDNEKEIWKWIVGYERWYEVSNKGNVRKINDDGSKRLLKACDVRPNYTRGRIVSLVKAGESQKVYQIRYLVAEAFNLKPIDDNKTLYHIDGNINNDCLSNLTYDIKETEKYIEEQRKIKEEQERLEREKQEQENHKEELKNYIEENKEFLQEAKERNSEVTIKDIYNKLCEILEVLKK